MTLRITRRAHYATLILYHLTCLAAHQPTAAESIAQALGIPSSSTKVVIRQLALAGLLQTTRGSQGGVWLARDPADISILEVVQAIDGPIVLYECNAGHDEGESSEDSALCQVWREVQATLVNRLRRPTFDQLCSNTSIENAA
jgi:Rrf2 family protein